MSDTQKIKLLFPEPDIAMLVFDEPARSVNILSWAVVSELNAHLQSLKSRTDIQGLIVTSAKPNCFVAGADIKELQARLSAPKSEVFQYCQTARKIYQRLCQLPFPSVAAIQGWALGGGLELALWCDGRILVDDPQTAIGFPEVKLGLIPGWGGTWTAAKLTGLGNAVELVCSGESINSQRAKQLGIADDVVSPASTDTAVTAAKLQHAAIQWIRTQQTSKAWQQTRSQRETPIVWSETELAFLKSMATAHIEKQTHGHYPAPIAGLDAMVNSVGKSVDEACDYAAQAMADLVGSPVNRALVHVYFATERNKKVAGSAAEGIRPVKTVGIVGVGIMGLSIAAFALKRGFDVEIYDYQTEALDSAVAKVLEEVAYNKQTRQADPARVAQFSPHLKRRDSLAEFSNCDLVIEAILESRDAKLELFAKLENILPPDSLIASNTSTISINEMGDRLIHPERFCGLHFFNPVRKMPLVEVIRGVKSDEQTIQPAVSFVKKLGKTPIVVNDGPGFMVNRILSPYLNESLTLLLEGVSVEDIDAAAVAFGMPIGPFAIYDMVGIDTSMYAGKTMYEAFRERYVLTPFLVALFKAGRFGQKSGTGFYKYQPGSEKPIVDPTLQNVIGQYCEPPVKMPQQQIIERLLLPMVLEATRVLDEQIVGDPRDIDLGVIFGLGFPAFRGGLLFWADAIGAEKLVAIVQANAKHGERWKPTQRLLDMAANKKSFHQN